MHARETAAQRLAFRWVGLGVAGATLASLAVFAELGGREGLYELGRIAATSLLFLGKFVIFFGLRDGCIFGPAELAVLCVLIDLVIAVGLGSGLERLERAPVIGRGLRGARLRALRLVTRFPGLERMAFFGVVGFVLLPLAATGAVSGSFAARFLGLSRAAGTVAIGLGSAGTAATFALLALSLGPRAERLARSPMLVALTLLALILLGRLAYLKVTRHLQQGAGPQG